MQPTDDSALLRQYVENHSDEAFATLVAQHLNLVYSVALRQVGNPHQAEEITQAVFIILAKKAAQLRHDQALASWLFQATRLTASNFVRGETRRHRREEEAYMQSVLDESGGEVWPRIAPLLDTAVGALREKDRRAIVLRFYEGRNLREIGLALGASEAAAEKRVNRALEKLHRFFTRHGISSTTAVIAKTISANSIQVAPAALAKTISAVAIAKGSTAAVSTLTLVKGTMTTMTWLKLKFAVGLCAALLIAGGAVTVAISQTGSEQRLTPGNPSPKDDVISAVKKLAESANYTFHITVAGSRAHGPFDGKTEKDGITYMKTHFGGRTVEAVVKGSARAYTDQDGKWQSLTVTNSDTGGVSLPGGLASDLLAGAKTLTKDGELYSGDLTSDGINTLLAPLTATNPSGWVKFWIKDGALTRFEYKVKANVNANGGEHDIDSDTTVEITDVGTTTVDVPEAAKKLLKL